MLTDVITRTGSNLLKVGVVVLLSSIATVAVKEQTNTALKDFTMDYRRIRTDWRNKHQLETNS